MILAAQNPSERQSLLRYLAQQIGEEPRALVGDMPYCAFASVRDERLLGVVVFLNYRRQSMEFHLTGAPGWVTRAEIRQLFTYAFDVLGVLRLWCMIRRNNKQARKGAERLGFKVLGVADDEFGEGKDGIVYSMKRSDCRWIKKDLSHG